MTRTRPLVMRPRARGLGLLLAVSFLTHAGCSTTSLGSTSVEIADKWIAAHDLDRAVITLRDQAQSAPLAGEISPRGSACQPTALPLSQIHLKQGTLDRTLPLASVQQIKVVQRGLGALEGGLIGMLAGGLSGATLGYAQGTNRNLDDCGYPCKAGDKARVGGLVFAGVGTVVGALVGAAVGHRDILVF